MRKSVRNDINRKVNAELANQAKSAEAAIDQIVSIRKLAESGKVADLPPGLQEFVRLRLRYPDASLKELGERAKPAPFEIGGVSSRSPSRGHGAQPVGAFASPALSRTAYQCLGVA